LVEANLIKKKKKKKKKKKNNKKKLAFFKPDHHFLSSPILKTSCRHHGDSIFFTEGAQRVSKTMTEVRKPGANSKAASVPFVF